MKYTIFYDEVKIGVLEINERGQHKYTPDENGVEQVKDKVLLMHDMLEKTDWRDPIPFFENRIENAKRFSHENDIYSHTDCFRMVKENN